MSITSVISKLEEAQGDPEKLALATLDIVLSTREPWVREALEAAAIPHWFTPAILAKLLEIDEQIASIYVEELKTLPMVETFAAREGWNVHEATRLALRLHLAHNQPERFRMLSKRAAEAFQGEQAYEKVECICHLLVAEPTGETSQALGGLFSAWALAGRHEFLQMLAVALGELLAAIPLEPVCRAQVLACYGTIARDRVPAKQIEAMARESVAIFQSLDDAYSEGDARSLLGDALCDQGRFLEARREYEEYKRIMLQLAERNPSNTSSLRELAVSHNRMGWALGAEGRHEEALREYQEFKRIMLELTKRDPDNTALVRELAVSHGNIGNVLEANGRREEALREYREYKRIMLELTKRDPNNSRWLCDLSISHKTVGRMLQAEGGLEEALCEFEESKRIALELTNRDPGNVDWLHHLGTCCNRRGEVLSVIPGRLEDALAEFRETLDIAARLIKLDPDRKDWAEMLEDARGWVDSLEQRLREEQNN